MEVPGMKVIACDGLEIAASVEGFTNMECPIYYPANFLIHVEQGILHLKIDGQTHTLQEGEFGLIRKYTQGTFFKTWEGNQDGFREHIFILHDAFIKEVIQEFELPQDYMPVSVPLIKFEKEPILMGLMDSLKGYITGQIQLDRQLIRIKTREALHALSRLNPNLIHIFNEFSEPSKADLVQFMEFNFIQNIPLEKFAQLSGRSLSTFNREFRKAFKMTPYKWIKQRRLELANHLLLNTQRKASDIYLEVGFEDLAHFSRSFKKYFGRNPSEVKFSGK